MAKVITVGMNVDSNPATGGAALNTERLVDFSIQIEATTGSYLIQASNDDGNNWQDVGGGAITADAFASTKDATNPLPVAKEYRIFTTTAGDAVATLHGIGLS